MHVRAAVGHADVMPAHACRFETDFTANRGGTGGHGVTVRTLTRDTEQQAHDIQKFCPRHYSAEDCGRPTPRSTTPPGSSLPRPQAALPLPCVLLRMHALLRTFRVLSSGEVAAFRRPLMDRCSRYACMHACMPHPLVYPCDCSRTCAMVGVTERHPVPPAWHSLCRRCVSVSRLAFSPAPGVRALGREQFTDKNSCASSAVRTSG